MCELKVKGLSGTGDCWSGCVADTETVEDKERPLTFSIHPNTFPQGTAFSCFPCLRASELV